MQKKNQKSNDNKPAKKTEYVVTEFFTDKKALKESLLALMVRDIKKL